MCTFFQLLRQSCVVYIFDAYGWMPYCFAILTTTLSKFHKFSFFFKKKKSIFHFSSKSFIFHFSVNNLWHIQNLIIFKLKKLNRFRLIICSVVTSSSRFTTNDEDLFFQLFAHWGKFWRWRSLETCAQFIPGNIYLHQLAIIHHQKTAL